MINNLNLVWLCRKNSQNIKKKKHNYNQTKQTILTIEKLKSNQFFTWGILF